MVKRIEWLETRSKELEGEVDCERKAGEKAQDDNNYLQDKVQECTLNLEHSKLQCEELRTET